MFRNGLKKITNILLFGVVFTLVSYITTYFFSPGSNNTPGNVPLAFGDHPSGGSDTSADGDSCDGSDSDCDSDGQ